MSLKSMRPGMPLEPSEGSSEVAEPKREVPEPLPGAVLGVPDWSHHPPWGADGAPDDPLT